MAHALILIKKDKEEIMGYSLSANSVSRLRGVHPDLVCVVKRAIQITEVDFAVIEGVRTLEKQQEYFEAGISNTMNSRHLTGHAVDLGAWVNGTISWDWQHYHKIYDAMNRAARSMNIMIEWGGHWQTLKDGVHFQLPWTTYPKG